MKNRSQQKPKEGERSVVGRRVRADRARDEVTPPALATVERQVERRESTTRWEVERAPSMYPMQQLLIIIFSLIVHATLFVLLFQKIFYQYAYELSDKNSKIV